MRPTFSGHRFLTFTLALALSPLGVSAQGAAQAPARGASPAAAREPAAEALPVLPSDYVIGPGDVLSVRFWRDTDMSSDVTVRPDGKITLPLLNELQASSFTPEQLRVNISNAASKLMQDPNVQVIVKEVNSRKVFITGAVAKPSFYPIVGAMSVLQLIATAGGLSDFADSKHITIVRVENGKQVSYPFNYDDVSRGRNLKQNIDLKPGDTVLVR